MISFDMVNPSFCVYLDNHKDRGNWQGSEYRVHFPVCFRTVKVFWKCQFKLKSPCASQLARHDVDRYWSSRSWRQVSPWLPSLGPRPAAPYGAFSPLLFLHDSVQLFWLFQSAGFNAAAGPRWSLQFKKDWLEFFLSLNFRCDIIT